MMESSKTIRKMVKGKWFMHQKINMKDNGKKTRKKGKES